MTKYRAVALFYFVLMGICFFDLLVPGTSQVALAGNEVMIIELEGPINPGNAMYVERGLKEAEKRDAALSIIRIDTPGGLGSSMRTIIKAILNSPVPLSLWWCMWGPRGPEPRLQE